MHQPAKATTQWRRHSKHETADEHHTATSITTARTTESKDDKFHGGTSKQQPIAEIPRPATTHALTVRHRHIRQGQGALACAPHPHNIVESVATALTTNSKEDKFHRGTTAVSLEP